MNIETILREEIRNRLDAIMGNPIEALNDLIPKNPRVQTHAAAGAEGLSKSVKRTTTSRIMDIPLNSIRFFETPIGMTDTQHTKRIAGFSTHIKKTHGCKISTRKVKGGVYVGRKVA